MADTYDDWYASLPTADELGQTFDREDSDRRMQESDEFQRSAAGRSERVRAREEGFTPRTWFGPTSGSWHSPSEPWHWNPASVGSITLESLRRLSTHVSSNTRTQTEYGALLKEVERRCGTMTPGLRGLAFVFDSTERSAALREAGYTVTDQGST